MKSPLPRSFSLGLCGLLFALVAISSVSGSHSTPSPGWHTLFARDDSNHDPVLGTNPNLNSGSGSGNSQPKANAKLQKSKPSKTVVDADDKFVSGCQVGTETTKLHRVSYMMRFNIDSNDDGSLDYDIYNQGHYYNDVHTTTTVRPMKAITGLQAARVASSGNEGSTSSGKQTDADPKTKTTANSKNTHSESENKGDPNSRATSVVKTKRSNDGSSLKPKSKGLVCMDAARKLVAGGFVERQHLQSLVEGDNQGDIRVTLERDLASHKWIQTLTYANGNVKMTNYDVDIKMSYFTMKQFCQNCKPSQKFHSVVIAEMSLELEEDEVDFASSLSCQGSASASRIVKTITDDGNEGGFSSSRKGKVANPLKSGQRPIYMLDQILLGGKVPPNVQQQNPTVKGANGQSALGQGGNPTNGGGSNPASGGGTTNAGSSNNPSTYPVSKVKGTTLNPNAVPANLTPNTVDRDNGLHADKNPHKETSTEASEKQTNPDTEDNGKVDPNKQKANANPKKTNPDTEDNGKVDPNKQKANADPKKTNPETSGTTGSNPNTSGTTDGKYAVQPVTT
ncbi:hypothetical protein ACQY0O_000590 [Thecaphora frezii]